MAKLSLGLGKNAPKVKDAPVETQESLYQKALGKMQAEEYILQKAYKKESFELAAAMFDQLEDYKDAAELAKQCRKKAEEAVGEISVEEYERACRNLHTAIDEAEWQRLVDTLEGLGDYKDAKQKLQEAKAGLSRVKKAGRRRRRIGFGILGAVLVCFVAAVFTGTLKYAYGRLVMQAGIYGQAREAFEGLGDFLDSARRAEMSEYLAIRQADDTDIVTFSTYRWRILKREEGKAYLMMTTPGEDSPLFGMAYHETQAEVTWENSSLKRYLNTEFLETIRENQRPYLLPITEDKTQNTQYGTQYTDEAQELVTILSAEQALSFAEVISAVHADFWLRTPGCSYENAAFRSGNGRIMTYGNPVSETNLEVFPVICLDYERAIQEG